MRVLALDTTTVDGSIAIVDEQRVIVERRGDPSRSHAERLPGELLNALQSADLTAADLDVMAVVAGPGSFTGLRIGIAAVQGIALVLNTPVVPLSALDVIATAAAVDQPPGTLVATWMDARRGEVFTALYRVAAVDPFDAARLAMVEPPGVGKAAAAMARWQAEDISPRLIAGDGATLYANVIGDRARVVPHPLLATCAARMAAARAAAGMTVHPAAIQPIYVRRPDVEVTRDAKRAEADAASPGGSRSS